MRINIVAVAACLALSGAALADQYDGLTPQQREWQDTSRFHDDWQRDGGGSGASSAGKELAAEIERSRAEARSAYEQAKREGMSVAAFRATMERLGAEAQRRQEEIRARQRAEYETLYESRYQQFLAAGGRGTKATPPRFTSNEAWFQWYLQQAEAGDPFGAYIVAREHFSTGKLDLAAQWLTKADLSNPTAAALYGYLLTNGAGMPRDTARGHAMMEKAAHEDTTGYSAHLLSSALFKGVGFEKDAARGNYYLALAAVHAEQPGLAESLMPLVQWEATMPQRDARRRTWRTEMKNRAVEHPRDYVAAMEVALKLKDYPVFGNMGGAIGELEPEPARKVYLEWLTTIENRPSAWDFWGRMSVIEGLRCKGYPDTAARSLLPDAIHRTAMSFIPLSAEQGENYWKEGGATVEAWANGTDDLAPRAARALVAREMGRWPKVSPRQAPRAVLDKIRVLGVPNPVDVLSGEILDGVQEARQEWVDKEKATPWLEELIALDGSLAELRAVYANAPALRAGLWMAGDPVLKPVLDALETPQTFTETQLDAAEAERNAAALLIQSNPKAAYDGLLKALQGGDSLAGWQLLLMNDQTYIHIAHLKQRLLDVTDARLQRDARGDGDRAATAALALHFLHNPDAPGREWLRDWRPTQASAKDWLKAAEEKGHPWAVFHSAGGYNVTEKVRDRYNAEARAIWPWVAANAHALQKQDLWRRDVRLLELFPAAKDIENIQPALDALETASVETVVFADMMPRLASARGLVAAYEKESGAPNRERAAALREGALQLAREDGSNATLLPRNRSRRLGLLVEAAIFGDADAPLEIAALLKDPGFPIAPEPDEARRWLDLGAARLEKLALTGPKNEAMDAAYTLATEYQSGATFPQDPAKAVEFHTIAATLGHQRSAGALRGAYAYGNLGLAKDPAKAKHWEQIADDIGMGRYKVPASALAGRGQAAAPAPKASAKPAANPAPAPRAKPAVKPKR